MQGVSLIKNNERLSLIYSCAYFFFLLFGYYLLRPLREEMAIRGGLDQLPWLWTGTALGMLAVSPLFATLASRFPRRKFIPIAYRFFAANLVLFFLLFSVLPGSLHIWMGYVFYVWLSVFNLFVVSVFWSFMTDVWSSEQGKRLFGLISLGGTLGAILGASVPAYLVQLTGTMPLFLFSALMLEITVQCVSRLVKIFELDRLSSNRGEPGPKVAEGFRQIVRSPYLLLIIVYALLFTVTNASLYFSQAQIIHAAYTDTLARTSIFARIDFWVNVLTLLTEAFGTGPLLRKFGLGLGLAFLPMISLFGFSALSVSSDVSILVSFVILRRAFHYAIERPSREVLFTAVGPDAKYKSKNFIDTFVFRVGDLAGAWLTKVGIAIALTAIPFTLAWIVCASVLAKWQKRLSEMQAKL